MSIRANEGFFARPAADGTRGVPASPLTRQAPREGDRSESAQRTHDFSRSARVSAPPLGMAAPPSLPVSPNPGKVPRARGSSPKARTTASLPSRAETPSSFASERTSAREMGSDFHASREDLELSILASGREKAPLRAGTAEPPVRVPPGLAPGAGRSLVAADGLPARRPRVAAEATRHLQREPSPIHQRSRDRLSDTFLSGSVERAAAL
jgi:hypothetical protein